MKLDPNFYDEIGTIQWFVNCGNCVNLPTHPLRAQSSEEALSFLGSPLWADVRTEAQGDLTGYLAKHHYTSYGGYWNNLAKESRARLEKDLMPKLISSLAAVGLPDITKDVMLDVNRAALEVSYAHRFPKIPRFFSRLLDVYRNGHLPCGWTEDMEKWPAGDIIAF